MALQRLLHETQRRGFVPLLRDVTLEHLAFVIDGTPEIMHLTIYPDVHLVEVPLPVPEAAHPPHPLAANISRKQWPEPVPPEPHCFMTNVDPALEQQILHIP